jgi:hypothetical protein
MKKLGLGSSPRVELGLGVLLSKKPKPDLRARARPNYKSRPQNYLVAVQLHQGLLAGVADLLDGELVRRRRAARSPPTFPSLLRLLDDDLGSI